MEKIDNKEQIRKLSTDRFCYYCDNDAIFCARSYLRDNSIDLIITDPPYGIEGHKLHKHYNRNEDLVIDGYVEIEKENYEKFSTEWMIEAHRILRPGGSIYIVSGWSNLHHILNALNMTKLNLINHIIWKYNFGVFTRQKFTTSHYHILYLTKPGEKPTFNTHSRFSPSQKNVKGGSLLYEDMEDVWIINREYKTGQIRYKNELPKELLIKMMQYSSNEGDLVLDFFAGSFSTIKVAKGLNRNSIGFEINKKVCEYQIPIVKGIKWGELIDKIQQGVNDNPKNQYKSWTEDDYKKVIHEFLQFRLEGLTKKEAINHLCKKYDRGYFSILNAIKKREELYKIN